MKTLLKYKFITALSLAAVFSMTSCVNEEYDLSEGIDMDMQLLQNVNLPVGDTGVIGITKLFGNTDSERNIFDTNSEGDLSVSFAHQTISESFTMPTINLDGNVSTKNIAVNFQIPSKYTEYPANSVLGILQNQGIDKIYCTKNGNPLTSGENMIDEQASFKIDKELSEEILSVKTLLMNGMIYVNFAASEGAYMHVEKGFVIEFPEFVVLSLKNEDVSYEVQEGHKVVFTEDTILSDKSPLVLELRLSALKDINPLITEKMNSNGQKRRYITADKELKAYGNVYISPADYGNGYIPSSPVLTIDLNTANLVMTSAEVMLDMNFDVEDQIVELGDLNSIFTGSNLVVDFYNPIIRFKIDNQTPLDLNINAEITSRIGTGLTDIHIGDKCKYGNEPTAAIAIPANNVSEYFLSRQGYHHTEGGTDIKIEELGDIIISMPETFSIHDILVETEKKFITVVADHKYDVNLELQFESQMAFGKELNIGFQHDFGLNFNRSTAGVGSLVLSMNMYNTLPLDLKLQCIALDEHGNQVGATALDILMKGGTIAEPTLSPAEIRFGTSSATDVSVSRLRFHISVSCSEEIQGNVLNTNQGLAIKDVVLSLPDGVKVDLENNFITDLFGNEE